MFVCLSIDLCLKMGRLMTSWVWKFFVLKCINDIARFFGGKGGGGRKGVRLGKPFHPQSSWFWTYWKSLRVTIDFFVNHNIGNYPCSQKVTCTNIRFNCYSSYTICFKFTGTNGLEDLEEGAEKDDGMGVWWRWFGLVVGILIVVVGCCCAVKLYGMIARPYR